ncbi:MAG: hypothetical protein CMJ83_00470 [Planctomycetes bacterium]|nr:hypothetical protein [Planctomycetota bacterium]
MPSPAIVITHGMLDTPFAKTAHGLIRGPSRWPVAAIVDERYAGLDAGEVMDGRRRGIPVVATVADTLTLEPRPKTAVVGVATPGGLLPEDLRTTCKDALLAGFSLVNGLHTLLAGEPELARAAEKGGGSIQDIRRPPPTSKLRFWTGEIRNVRAPRLALLGTDCAVGKRTTGQVLQLGLSEEGVSSELVYTGQTGWLQGLEHGFILDATPNDFVSGELERAIVACDRERHPDVILVEGQSSLRNPSGPCGAELLLSAEASGVILQHAPARTHFEDLERVPCPLPPIEEEIALIGAYGAPVIAVALNGRGIEPEHLIRQREEMMAKLGIAVSLPLEEGPGVLVNVVRTWLAAESDR